MDDILKLKEMLDVDTFAPVAKQLQQKAWLMHWSLFVFFNHENGLNALIDLFMQDRWGRGRVGGGGGGRKQAGSSSSSSCCCRHSAGVSGLQGLRSWSRDKPDMQQTPLHGCSQNICITCLRPQCLLYPAAPPCSPAGT